MKGEISYMYLFLYIVPLLLMIMAQSMVTNAYHRYRQIQSMKGYTGEMVAHLILDRNNVYGVDVCVTDKGQLSDFYDPKLKRVCLSSEVYYGNSIASIAIAAHECGHALQDSENYSLISIRNKILPYVNISSNVGWVILLLGFMSNSKNFIYLALGLLIFATLFQVLTLPIELDASKRALQQLTYNAMVYEEETLEVKNMLKAAAFTYIAALISAVAYIFRILLILGNRRR